MVECPCRREGEGCINYRLEGETYTCLFTGQEAFVPRSPDDTGVTPGMYGSNLDRPGYPW